MSQRIDGDNIFVDVDSTLCFDSSDLTDEQRAKCYPTILHCFGRNITIFPHKENLALIHKLYNRGYNLVVWSHSGSEWAEAVCRALCIADMVTLYMTKPKYHVDDLPCEQWMGERIYREFRP